MVKQFLFYLFIICALKSQSQNLNFGIGLSGQNSSTDFNKKTGFDIIDLNDDTLKISFTDLKLSPINSIPIWLRYNSKKRWWLQINYSSESWRVDYSGFTEHTDKFVRTNTLSKMFTIWKSNHPNGTFDSFTKSPFYQEFKDEYFANEKELQKSSFNSYEIQRYNKLTIGFGSRLNNKGKVKIYYGLGVDYMINSSFESYQGFNFNDKNVSKEFKILEKLPKLEDNHLAPFVNLGIEKQGLRLGFDLRWFRNPIFNDVDVEKSPWTVDSGFDKQTVKYFINYGVHLNYTLFSQNFGQKEIEAKSKVLESRIIGKYKARPKLIRLGLTASFPSIHNSGWSTLDGFQIEEAEHLEIDKLLIRKQDSYLTGLHIDDDEIEDNLYLEKRLNDIFVNEDGFVDTNVTYQTIFLSWGNINSIIKSPKISGFIAVFPHRFLSLDFNFGYQKHSYGIEAYEFERKHGTNEKVNRMRKLLYQENFNEISFGLTGNFAYPITNTSKVGFHGGVIVNSWLSGRFTRESGGMNDSDLLLDFHNYFIKNEGDTTWNRNINRLANKGVFSKKDYALFNYDSNSEISKQKSYHKDFTEYLFDNWKKRRSYEIRLGADYYIDNFRFSIYYEKSLWKEKSLYNALSTFGMSVSMYIN